MGQGLQGGQDNSSLVNTRIAGEATLFPIQRLDMLAELDLLWQVCVPISLAFEFGATRSQGTSKLSDLPWLDSQALSATVFLYDE